MIRKKYIVYLLLMCLIFVPAGCGVGKETPGDTNMTIETGKTETEEPQTKAPQAEGTEAFSAVNGENSGVTARFEVFEVTQDGLLAYGMDEACRGLCRIGHGDMLENQQGERIETSDLLPGMIVELTWDGIVQESYPMRFAYSGLKLTGESGSPEFMLYLQLIQDLAEADPGLNEGVEESYFDFTGILSLKDYEKEGLAYLGGICFGSFGTQSTEEELAEQGVLDREKGIEKGILVTIEELTNKNGKVTCNAKKYRSGTGAYYFHDVTAEYKDGKWTYNIGAEMIS